MMGCNQDDKVLDRSDEEEADDYSTFTVLPHLPTLTPSKL